MSPQPRGTGVVCPLQHVRMQGPRVDIVMIFFTFVLNNSPDFGFFFVLVTSCSVDLKRLFLSLLQGRHTLNCFYLFYKLRCPPWLSGDHHTIELTVEKEFAILARVIGPHCHVEIRL